MAKKEWLILLAVTAIGALLRFLLLDTVPIGWHHDEALMGIMASEVYHGTNRPIFFEGYLGQEPLYIYLAAGVMWLMGGDEGVMPLRIASALIGVATIPVTYFLGRALLGWRVGAVTSALAAASFWLVMFSRLGFRVVTQPLVEGLAILLLWQAFRRNSLPLYVLGGVALGGTLYTYLGARLFPIVPLAFAVWWLLTRRPVPRYAWRGIIVSLVFATLTATPLGLYFLEHPSIFSGRIDQVSIFQSGGMAESPLQALASNVDKLINDLAFQADIPWRFGLPDRPLLPWPGGLLACVGAFVVAKGAWQRRPAEGLLFVWLVVMPFSALLSFDVAAFTPRLLGLVPAVFFLPAIGFWALADYLRRRVRPSRQRLASIVAVGLCILFVGWETISTCRDYFVVWADSYGAASESMADVRAEAEYLSDHVREGDDVLVSCDIYLHPTILDIAPNVRSQARWFDGRSALVIPRPDRVRTDALYVVPASATSELVDVLPSTALVASETKVNWKLFEAFRLTPADIDELRQQVLSDPELTTVDARFGDDVRLIGYKVHGAADPGGAIELTAIWEVPDERPRVNLWMFSLVAGAANAQIDSSAFPAWGWRAGDIFLEHYVIPISRQVQPGRYPLQIGVYNRDTMERLDTVQNGQKRNFWTLGTVTIVGAIQAAPPPQHETSIGYAQNVQLSGYSLAEPTDRRLSVSLYWRSQGPLDRDYTVFVQVLDATGKLVAQNDSYPAQGRLPTSMWQAGETIYDHHVLALDRGLADGEYTVIAGLYDVATMTRLPRADGSDYVELARFVVQTQE